MVFICYSILFKLMNKSIAVHESLAFLKSGENLCGTSRSPFFFFFLFGIRCYWNGHSESMYFAILFSIVGVPVPAVLCAGVRGSPFESWVGFSWPQRDDTSHTFWQRSQWSRLELLGIFKRMCKQNQWVALQCFLWSVMKS